MNWQKDQVHLIDVTARDGFQMEKEWIPTNDKIAIIQQIVAAGINKIEVTSFVSPKAVPQLKDARDVIARVRALAPELKLVALIPNLRGAELAAESQVDEVNLVISISESHNQQNIRSTVEDSLARVPQIKEVIDQHNKLLHVGLATTFGCPFEGLYEVAKVELIIERLTSFGCTSIGLADTTGMANPRQVYEFCTHILNRFPTVNFALHFHNTRGMSLANVLAGYQAGIHQFEATLGGIGGCPFAPGATGNVCLEDVAHMFEQMGMTTNLNLDRLISAAAHLEKVLGYTLPGQIMKSGKSTDVFTI